MSSFSNGDKIVLFWYLSLSFIAVVNVAAWFVIKKRIYPNQQLKSLLKWTEPQNVIWYSMAYVFVCAIRTWLPRADVQRICLWDTWFSSVLFGRSIATIAELAFIVQWSVVLRFYGQNLRCKSAESIGRVIVVLIFLAEVCSWYAVITTNYLGNSIEESLWALSYGLIFLALLDLQRYLSGGLRRVFWLGAFGCLLYIGFMTYVDIPMYINRLIVDLEQAKPLLNLVNGFKDLNSRWVVTWSQHDWKSEMPWQTLYFTVAVWTSLGLCILPMNQKKSKDTP